MPKKAPPKKPKRERFNLDLDEKTRARFAGAAGKLHLSIAAFVRLAAEEKIRRDGLA